MLTVITYVAPSAIEGVGVFAAEPIAKGRVISCFDEAFDRLIPRDAYENAPPFLKTLLDRYAFPHPGNLDLIVYEVDNSRFMNHSSAPNTDFSNFAAGEELTCDYNSFFAQYELLPPELQRAAMGG